MTSSTALNAIIRELGPYYNSDIARVMTVAVSEVIFRSDAEVTPAFLSASSQNSPEDKAPVMVLDPNGFWYMYDILRHSAKFREGRYGRCIPAQTHGIIFLVLTRRISI